MLEIHGNYQSEYKHSLWLIETYIANHYIVQFPEIYMWHYGIIASSKPGIQYILYCKQYVLSTLSAVANIILQPFKGTSRYLLDIISVEMDILRYMIRNYDLPLCSLFILSWVFLMLTKVLLPRLRSSCQQYPSLNDI